MISVIINADDFGLNEHCSKAIAQAFERELITDTTMVATGEYFNEAVVLAKEQGFIHKIGVHLNLTEGTPLTQDINNYPMFVSQGKFHGKINRTRKLRKAEKMAVYKELSAQVDKIQSVGIKITHADSHHHIHTGIFIAPIVARVCREHGIEKIRLHRNIGNISEFKMFVKKRYNNWLKKQGFKTTAYFGSLLDIENAEVPDDCEIMVHPDLDKNGILIDRIDETDGIPVGRKLPDLRAERKVVTLRGYAKL